MPKPELLAPAGDMEKLRVACAYGADAVYIGGREFSLRQGAGNFAANVLAAADPYAHRLGKKLYLAVNVFAHNEDILELPTYLAQAEAAKVDALIISDLGVFNLAQQYAPSLPLHISTQANTVNWASAAMWARLGAKRVILGRELTLTEMAQISAKAGVETECFVHGAMCMSYSGRCLLSNFLTGRDANRGDCSQPCRWRYALQEEKRPGQFMPIEEDSRGSYIFNSRDLCLIDALPQLLATGVSALKIEGRNKSAYYIANVARIYRQAIDMACAEGKDFFVRDTWRQELSKISHREYTQGFAFGKPDAKGQRYESGDPLRGYDFTATVLDMAQGRLILEQRNHFAVGDILEILLPDGCQLDIPLTALSDAEGNNIATAAHPCMTVSLPLDAEQQKVLAAYPLPLIVRRVCRG